jgi:nicotinamide mononucleotide adenylyltransferase
MSQDSYFNSNSVPPIPIPIPIPMSRSKTYAFTGKPFTDEEQRKIQLFETNKNKYLSSFVDARKKMQQAELDDKNNTFIRQGKYYYFIGRLNPPHEGHIAALLSVIQQAIHDKGIAIILLGSGPNGGERTSKDPLDFDLKSRFVEAKLKERLTNMYPNLNIDELFTNGRIQIKEMGKPAEQIREVIREDIINNLFDELNAARISGAKDGDIVKLAWIEKALSAGIIDAEGNLIPITTQVIPEPPVTNEGIEMSATQVREDARLMSFDDFFTKYGEFYTNFTQTIWQEIRNYPPSVDVKAVTTRGTKRGTKRKEPTILEKGGTRKGGTRKGGTRKGRRTRKTKGRKTKRRTKRRRSRRSRMN